MCAEKYLGFMEMLKTFNNTLGFKDSNDLNLTHKMWLSI